MSKVLIVDDQDRSIQYSGSWSSENNVGDYTNEYLNTVHKSTTIGDSLEYSFVGTGISVYGTLNMPQSLGLPTPRFSIDNNDPTAFNASGEVANWDRGIQISHALLYRSPKLPKSNHTINIVTGSPPGANSSFPGPFYLDFFTVDSGSDSVAGDVILDDRDQALLFSGTWPNSGVVDEYMGTTRVSPSEAYGGTMTFQFNGTAITVYGTTGPTVNQGTTKISFSIDGQSTTFEGKKNLPAVRHQAVFQATSLGMDKPHTLTITPLNGNPLFLDYFVYRTTNSSNNTPNGHTNVQHTSDITPIIIGSVIGAVVIFFLVAVGFSLWMKKRAKKDARPGFSGRFPDHAGVAELYRVPARGEGNPMAYADVNPHLTVGGYRSTGSNMVERGDENMNGGYVSGSTVLYPQFEGVYSRSPPRSPVSLPSVVYPPMLGPHDQSEKAHFMNMDRRPPSSPAVKATARSTILSSSPAVDIDDASQLRPTSPPMYTD